MATDPKDHATTAMTHLQFVITSYAAAATGLAGLFIWLLVDRQRQLSTLRRLEKAGQQPQQFRRSLPQDTRK